MHEIAHAIIRRWISELEDRVDLRVALHSFDGLLTRVAVSTQDLDCPFRRVRDAKMPGLPGDAWVRRSAPRSELSATGHHCWREAHELALAFDHVTLLGGRAPA
jgi:hypothetical protein